MSLAGHHRSWGNLTTERTAARAERVIVAVNRKFTRIPKTTELVAAGVPAEAIGTYCCLADHANNKSGLCFPKMKTIAQILNRSARTIQRHLHLLRDLGLIEFVERRRYKGRFSSYLYRILFHATSGHGRPVAERRTNIRGTKPLRTAPKSPSKSVKDGYHWLFEERAPADTQETHDLETRCKQKEEARRRTDGYKWLFGK